MCAPLTTVESPHCELLPIPILDKTNRRMCSGGRCWPAAQTRQPMATAAVGRLGLTRKTNVCAGHRHHNNMNAHFYRPCDGGEGITNGNRATTIGVANKRESQQRANENRNKVGGIQVWREFYKWELRKYRRPAAIAGSRQ